MEIIEAGHVYRLDWLDGDALHIGKRTANGQRELQENDLIFVNREGRPHAGTQTQEVLRALIDRTMHCDNCIRWLGNDLIIHHLRMALVLHEARALERKVEKGELTPERVALAVDGHFKLKPTPIPSDDARTYKERE